MPCTISTHKCFNNSSSLHVSLFFSFPFLDHLLLFIPPGPGHLHFTRSISHRVLTPSHLIPSIISYLPTRPILLPSILPAVPSFTSKVQTSLTSTIILIVANNPNMVALQQQQRALQQQRIMAQQMGYGNMGANGMPMNMNMNAAQFAAMRSNSMRQVGLPPHMQQAHLQQQGQHPNPQHAQVCYYMLLHLASRTFVHTLTTLR